jgi:hypothetical protein
MDEWRKVEIYGNFMKVGGEFLVSPPDRMSDSVNRIGGFLKLRNASVEPMSVNYPVISQTEPKTTIAKQAVILICPVSDHQETRNDQMWRHKLVQAVAINTHSFSMVGDVHLEPRMSLQDQIERTMGDFLPITNLSALWIATAGSETHSLQRPFALLNPASILSFALRG